MPFRNRNIKVVLSIHDINLLYDPSKAKLKKKRNLRRLQLLINQADVIICISEFCKKDVLTHCDVKNKPVHVIYNGTNALAEPELLKQSYKPVKPFIFAVGTINPKKNFHTLLPLVEDEQELELIIAGKIDDRDYYQSIVDTIEKTGLSEKVKLVGPVSETEKSWYLNHCSAFAFPSTAEGFGLPVTEAMSVGKPLFLANATALPEIGGDVAFYFDNFSAAHMKEVFVTGMKKYTENNMQDEIIKKGKEYSWDIAAQKYWNVYRSLY
ncbi:MAG: glycosyltransferase family 1 protein [Ferruginibacter sp.]